MNFATPRDVTPRTLSDMLSFHSTTPVDVISFESERIGIGTGWGGSTYRLYNIQYSPEIRLHPAESLVLKISHGIWNGFVASNEPEFYLKLKPRISNIQIPKCYYLAHHPFASRKSLLLLEDLSINCDPLGPNHLLKDSTIFSLITLIASLHAEFFTHIDDTNRKEIRN